ncbi:hypothetical protein C484_11231 [Natrialba taiwanensis DSM 12281]|uniref:Methyltransferase FkbM domain-containing protein n=2 Tax=Natrialba taiwanensis TaxID=160846 RepID=L9ZYW7_9EURY|nr:hypothetical protein C484_11231 [Natrialba taiwanensis DSM 12281]
MRCLFHGSNVEKYIRQIGLDQYLSGPYWSLVHRFSNNTQTHTIVDQSVEFRTESFTEFMRFQNLNHEQPVIKNLLCSIDSDDVFYDIGANVGTYTCFVAPKIDRGQIVSFEPEPHNAMRLQDNLDLNDFDSQIIRVALTDTNTTIDFALSGNETGEGEHAISLTDGEDTIKVEAARGDSIIDQRNLEVPTVLKIDVEGAELSTLRGFKKTIHEHARLVYVEVHPEKLPEFGGTVSEVRAFLEGAGFDVAEIPQKRSEVFLRASK